MARSSYAFLCRDSANAFYSKNEKGQLGCARSFEEEMWLQSAPAGGARLTPPQARRAASSAVSARPVIILPGLGNNSGDYEGLVAELKSRGVPSVVVAKVSRVDWLRNAAGLLDGNYWRGTLSPRPILDWYLRRVDEAVAQARNLSPDGDLALLGHSAGGWLARLYLEELGCSDVSLLLTLGTPHLPPPKGLPGVIDQTRGLLYYVEERCSPAVYTPERKYVCVAGRYIKGLPLIGASQDAADNRYNNAVAAAAADGGAVGGGVGVAPAAGGLNARLVGQGYKQVCGRADVWGDGVVPEISAHLEGALNISLDGVYHSPVGADPRRRPWYGSPAVLDSWFSHLLSSEDGALN
ncbi:alpha/beta-Hydrolases superfamily protein [Wolffia australiana]